jgi:hypothetical protein
MLSLLAAATASSVSRQLESKWRPRTPLAVRTTIFKPAWGVNLPRAFACICVVVCCASVSAFDQKPGNRILRWDARNPDCSVTASGGMHRYSINYETLKVTLSVDDNELKKTNRTAGHVFSALVTLNNHGTQRAEIAPADIKLELVEHHHDVMHALPPDVLAKQIQDSSDELVYQGEKTIKKHPEKKDALEARLKEHQELVLRWQEFISTQALRSATVDTGRPEVNGWVFFSTRSKWLGSWKDREEFILRIPIGKHVFEFPFALPADGMPTLRERGQPQG